MSTLPGRKIIQAATVIEQLDDDLRLRRRLEQDPGDNIASVQLETMYRERGEWEPLVDVLLDRAACLESMEAASVLTEVADIYTDHLGEPAAALAVLLAAFARNPDSARLADRLCQLAEQTGEWGEIIDAFTVEAAKLSGRADAVASELWLRAAWAHLAGESDVESAAAALEQVADLRSPAALAVIDHIEASASSHELLELLCEISVRIGDKDRLLRTLNRRIALSQDDPSCAPLHAQIADMALEQGDTQTAEWHLVEALRFDPANARIVDALTEIYKERGEFLKAARLLERCREAVANPLDQIQLSFEAANIYGALDEETLAADLYESALSMDPEHVGAAVPLAERYYRAGRWYELEPIMDMLVRRSSALSHEAPTLMELCRRAGETAAKLGKHDKARRYYESALTQCPEDVESLLGMGEVLRKAKAWDEANATFAAALSLIEYHGDADRAADVLVKMGECCAETGDQRGAQECFRRVLRYQPDRVEALTALADAYEHSGDYVRAVELKQSELPHASKERKVRLLADIGRISSRQLRDPARAITVFQQALEIDPHDREILHQLVEHYSAAGWWEDAVEVILAIVQLEQQPIRRGKYFQAAAVILRTEMGDAARAADCYDEALDCFYGAGAEMPESLRPSCMKAFTDAGKMLSQAQMWKRLEQSYRRMIKRINPEDPIAADLWHGLGEIYRRHLGHNASAIGSFEVAAALDDRRLTRHRILVDLYESAGPEKALEAISRRHRLLRDEPLVTDHYKALRKLYARTKQYDRAWCACRALSYLGDADHEEQAFLDSRMPQHFDWGGARANEAMWELLRDSSEVQDVSAIFALVAGEAAVVTAVEQRDLGLDPNVSGTPQFAEFVRTIATALGVSAPDVFVHPHAAGEVLWANAKNGRSVARTIAIGQDLYQARDMRYMAAAIAKAVVYSRPAYLLRMASADTAELEAIFLAASSLSRADVPVPAPLVAHVGAYRRHFESVLAPGTRRALALAVDRYVAAGKPYDLTAWCKSVDMTSRRAALVVSSDLAMATSVGGTRLEGDDAADLLRYSVSEEHFALRERLGLARD